MSKIQRPHRDVLIEDVQKTPNAKKYKPPNLVSYSSQFQC